MQENEAHYTHAWLARRSGSYRLEGPPLKVAIVSGALPNLGSARGARRGDRGETCVLPRVERARAREVA